ncbi:MULTISPECIES: hypothetical protein [Dehalococcoides]|uniref:HNH endonuclease n=1 Tax=Dehalococcoides mccartyi TaxID=61435 RepID=A0AB38Z8G6_9CHLR|nr:hypothetical protein [Dehalococcoides mccartyi]OBW61632.1 MAG: hypothetical protein A9181_01110 [Dehalococcoides mccartyi]WRO06863.1 hypothetical protein VLL09_05605 [Dehalococcoides mccartyi]
MTRRDDFSKNSIDILAKRAGQLCSNPECGLATSGLHSSSNKAIITGVAAHICAAAPGGKRYDVEMTSEERTSIDNGIWLCATCAKLIDSDEKIYTVKLLKKWKYDHEHKRRKSMLHASKDTTILSDELSRLSKSASPKSSLNPDFRIQVTTNSENLPVYSHISTSGSNPVAISFTINYSGSKLIEYLQIHTWLLYGRVVRSPEVWESSSWQPQEIECLPRELTMFAEIGSFKRYMLSLSPHDKFYLMASQHPKYLPELDIEWMTFIGMIPIPWQIEIPGEKPIFGVILLWVSEHGILTSESVPVDTDWNSIDKRLKEIIKKYKPDKSEMQYTGITEY